MNKLLHERLRDIALRGGYLNCVRTLIGKEECPNGDCRDCVKQAAKTLADEIEKYYIPRPRFQDGEPVQFGDDIEIYNRTGLLDGGIIQSFHPNKGLVWILSLVGVNHERLVRFDPNTCVIKRPEPKILDANGVEIKVGDTVWDLDSGEKLTVVEFANREHGIVQCSNGEDEYYSDHDAHRLTHREPDSLKKLRDDLKRKYGSNSSWVKRLTAIMERDA